MWQSSFLAAISLFSSIQRPVEAASEVDRCHDALQGIVSVLDQSPDSLAPAQALAPRLSLLEQSLSKISLKMRLYSGSKGNVGHWIGTYSAGTTKVTALFEENSSGVSYSGVDLRLNQVRFTYGQDENRERYSIILYGENNSYAGFTGQGSSNTGSSVFGGAGLSRSFSLDAGVVSDGDARMRLLHDSGDSQVSAAFGRNSQDNLLGSASWNDQKTWLSVQGGESIPTSYRLTLGEIDKLRSKRAFGFVDGGLYEAFPHAATFRFAMGEGPVFHLLRRIPGQFLGKTPGDIGLDVLCTEGASVDISAGVRLPGIGSIEPPCIGGRVVRNLKQKADVFGLEIGGTRKRSELRARVEYQTKSREMNFGILFTTTLEHR